MKVQRIVSQVAQTEEERLDDQERLANRGSRQHGNQQTSNSQSGRAVASISTSGDSGSTAGSKTWSAPGTDSWFVFLSNKFCVSLFLKTGELHHNLLSFNLCWLLLLLYCSMVGFCCLQVMLLMSETAPGHKRTWDESVQPSLRNAPCRITTTVADPGDLADVAMPTRTETIVEHHCVSEAAVKVDVERSSINDEEVFVGAIVRRRKKQKSRQPLSAKPLSFPSKPHGCSIWLDVPFNRPTYNSMFLTRGPISVSDLANIIDEKPVAVIKFLMTDLGVMASMTQNLDPATCIAVVEGFGKVLGGDEEYDEEM